jgi:hypothetical protein
MKHGRLILGIIIAFTLVDAILFFFLFAKTSKTSISFVSLKPGYSSVLAGVPTARGT